MNDNRSHPLLAQIPLTVSPFVTLPTATTLPYTYKPLPSTLPPSSTQPPSSNKPPNSPSSTIQPPEKPAYVLSTSGHAAHPDEIIASCRALQQQLQDMQDESERVLREWEEGIRQRELAEKRRIAPGWLDAQERILEPVRREGGPSAGSEMQGLGQSLIDDETRENENETEEGEELDRAFGSLGLRP